MKKNWWNGKVAYQIWPKSFCDANGDGIGDLQGILSKLDYLQALGVDILWLSPIYKSPFVDQGYDIADYYAIAEEFGTMEDFDRLLAETKKRGMYIIMDLVVNHCSDQHDWFQKALTDPYGEYAERFWFVPGRRGGPPSNYRSYFGGSTWERVPGTELYYLHMFAKEQPDLNWENPVVRQKIYDMVNWWLEKGLAGFRIDAIINIKKVPGFPDYPADGPDGLAACTKMVEAAEGVGDFLQELKRETFAKYDALTVGEVFHMKEDQLAEFIGDEGHFSTMFDFSAHELTLSENGWYDNNPLRFEDWRRTLFAAQRKVENVGFWANILENHDEPRAVSRYLLPHAQNETGAKMLGTTSLLLRGIPFIFQGQEIGMTNCRRTDISQYDDINTKDQYQVALDAGCTEEQALEACYVNSRDNARTPVQWSDAPHGGFTTGEPWLAVNPNYKEINVVEQEGREDSVLNHYRRLVALRKSADYGETFTYGAFEPVWEAEPDILAYLRRDENRTILVAGNYGAETRTVTLPAPARELLLSNLGREKLPEGTELTLEPCESVVMMF